MLSIEAVKNKVEFDNLVDFFHDNLVIIPGQTNKSDRLSAGKILENYRSFAIYDSDTEEIVGGILILLIDFWNHRAEIRFVYKKNLENSSIRDAFDSFFFFEFNLHRVFWITDQKNETFSERISAKCEGRMKAGESIYSVYALVSK